MASLYLAKPNLDLLPAFLAFAEEMKAHDEDVWEPYLPAATESQEQYIARMQVREINPPSPLVPETVYWGVLDGHVVGRISLRHRIEGNLLKMGGHIGYEVRPSFRRRGLAKEMLRLVLETPKAKEIGNFLLTCAPDNVASNKTILANGGRLTQKIFVESLQEDRNHYWITLDSKK